MRTLKQIHATSVISIFPLHRTYTSHPEPAAAATAPIPGLLLPLPVLLLLLPLPLLVLQLSLPLAHLGVQPVRLRAQLLTLALQLGQELPRRHVVA